MRILRFDIQNDKAVESFVHEANGQHVEIAGQTGTGKTTAASALWDIVNKSPDCLRHGTRKGHITLHIGDGKPDLIASREFTKSTSTIKIERADGSKVGAADFKAMLSALSENPHKIAEMKPKERVETLLKAADLGDQSLDELDEQIAGAEQARLTAGRRAEENTPGPEPEKAEPVDVSALSAEMQKANATNMAIRDAARELEIVVASGKRVAEKVADIKADIAETEERLRVLRIQLVDQEQAKAALGVTYTEQKAALDNMKAVDVTGIQRQLASATERNSLAARHAQWKERKAKHEDLEQQRACADETVKELRDQRKELLENAKWPIKGLSIEDGDVLYNGVLFENLGGSEQKLVCAALAIKDILAHPLHVVRIDGAESMSERDFRALQDLFGSHEIQVISTRVCEESLRPGELVIQERSEQKSEAVSA